MHWRTKLGALVGAGGLVLLATSAVMAVPPTYTISVSKTADPATVPVSGGSVEYTIWVDNTGTGHFNVVVVDDGMAGCTLGAPTGDTDVDTKLDSDETWAYTCTVTGVTPGTQNTATVNACHDNSACVASHDAQDTGSVTVTEGEAPTEAPPTEAPPTEAPPTEAPPTEAPPTEAPVRTINPSQDVAGATEPTTDTASGVLVGTAGDKSLLLVLALGLLLASLVLVTPARTIRQR